MTATASFNESDRLLSLKEYNILDTLPEEELDDITRIASFICGTPVALITLLDSDRQWFKSRHGIDIIETPIDYAFCSHTILNPEDILIVPNLSEDERFAENPLVSGPMHVRFYAGVPLLNQEGYPLGTLCVLDSKPKQLNDEQIRTLKALAKQVVCQFELRKTIKDLDENNRLLKVSYEDIEQFSRVVAHDLKTPCASTYLIADILYKELEGNDNKRLKDYAHLLKQSSMGMTRMIDGILQYAASSHISQCKKEYIDINRMVDDICNLTGIKRETIIVPHSACTIYTYKMPLQQILLNLILNAIKYNDKAKPEIKVGCTEEKDTYLLCISDNGPGMSSELQKRAFDLFFTSDSEGDSKTRGYGIGLATVRRLVQKLKGSIHIEAVPANGTAFIFTIGK